MKSIIKLFKFSVFLFTFSCNGDFQLSEVQTSRIEINRNIQDDSTILNFIEPYKKNIEKDLYTTYAYSPKTYDKKNGNLNTAIGNFMADAVYELSNPIFKSKKGENIDFVLLNYGGIRSVISKGNINKNSAYNLMPFENEVIVTKLSGKDVYKLIDYLTIARRAHPIARLQLELDKDYKLINAKINNKKIDVNSYYYVATSDFLLNGGDKMTFFNESIENTILNYKIRDLLIDYFIQIDTLKSTIDNRFIIKK
ncbi:MAG: 5'-nucleotidase C-terminal domain-containing protein [Flavobacteriales bacterium]|tara:strand:+ start:21012 stop:21770 length:759 start_codon:yes stop_codon:yes gene_type:complete